MQQIKQLKFFEQSSYFRIAKEEFNTLITDSILRKVIQFTILLMGLDFCVLAILWAYLPPQLPLLYSRPWGLDQLVSKSFFIFLPLSSLLLIIINLIIASLAYKKEALLSKILVFSSGFVCLLCNIALIQIIIIST